jgi:hypothetical protein
MNTNRWMGFAGMSFLLLGLLTLWISARPGQAQSPEQQQQAPIWEYKFVEAPDRVDENEKVFNDLGKERWEYCESRPMMKVTDPSFTPVRNFIIFKRPTKATQPGPK